MKTISREEFEKQNVFGTGAENTGFAQYFIGNSYLNPLTDPRKSVYMEQNDSQNDQQLISTNTHNKYLLFLAAPRGGRITECIWQPRARVHP